MSVIVIDDICNLNCDYCFYSSVLSEKRDELIKSWKLDKDKIYFNKEYVKKIADKIYESNFEIDLWKKSVVITWWEPTMHPEFIELMKYFILKWLDIHLLTNFVFQKDWEVYKFLQKNKNKFRFLVNFNEISRQPASKITKQNLIDFDYEHIKIWINLYHHNYNFNDVIDILKNTKNIHTIRLWLPNSQVDEWINMWILKSLKDFWYTDEEINQIKQKYKEDLFETDYEHIKNTWKWIEYWLLDKKIYDYYHDILWNELKKFISLLKWNNLDDRVDFYVDCWFDYKILPEDVCWFILQRLHYKNPCSIPNWVCIQTWWAIQQCYSIWTYWNFTKNELTIKWKSIRDLNNYYILSSTFLQFWFLNQIFENNFEMCRWNNLRFFKQLFTRWTFNSWTFELKDYNISQKWNSSIWYELKDVVELTKKYLEWYNETNNILFLTRIFQLIEFNLVHFELENVWKILNEIQLITLKKKTENNFHLCYFYYDILYKFLNELKEITLNKTYFEKQEQLREKYLNDVKEININYNHFYWDQPHKQLSKLDTITKTIIKKQIYID